MRPRTFNKKIIFYSTFHNPCCFNSRFRERKKKKSALMYLMPPMSKEKKKDSYAVEGNKGNKGSFLSIINTWNTDKGKHFGFLIPETWMCAREVWLQTSREQTPWQPEQWVSGESPCVSSKHKGPFPVSYSVYTNFSRFDSICNKRPNKEIIN